MWPQLDLPVFQGSRGEIDSGFRSGRRSVRIIHTKPCNLGPSMADSTERWCSKVFLATRFAFSSTYSSPDADLSRWWWRSLSQLLQPSIGHILFFFCSLRRDFFLSRVTSGCLQSRTAPRKTHKLFTHSTASIIITRRGSFWGPARQTFGQKQHSDRHTDARSQDNTTRRQQRPNTQ